MTTQFICDEPGCGNVDDLDNTAQYRVGGFYCAVHQSGGDEAFAAVLEQYDPDEHDVING